MTRRLASILLVAAVILGACSGNDDEAGPTTTSSAPRSTTTTEATTSSTSTTQPPATDVEAVTPILQELMGRYDAAVAAILADPRVALDPTNAQVESYLSLFTDNSTFADGALANWAREGEQGRFYRPGTGGQLTRSTVIAVTPADDDEATFTICAENSMEITDSKGNVVESFGGQTAASVVAVRADGVWRIRDLTEAATSGCPERGAER
jgi:hypothetical protein